MPRNHDSTDEQWQVIRRLHPQTGEGWAPTYRPPGVKEFAVLPKHWIVERTFAWLSRRRRHDKDYERNPESSVALIQISMIGLLSRRPARANT